MMHDRYDNPISTTSEKARDAYIKGVDALLSANAGAELEFQKAINADESFALAYAALARACQISGRGVEATESIAKAESLSDGVSTRELSHIAMLGHLIGGRGADAVASARAHVMEFPRDTMIVQPLTSVFGLIGFSGLAGREAEQLAFLTTLAPSYGDDWWFNCQFAFAQVEVGQTDRAWNTIAKSLDGNPRNAHAAHIRTHIHYERDDAKAGLIYLTDWYKDLDRKAVLHCHITWHLALWNLEFGNSEQAWAYIDDGVRPSKAWGPALNVMTDTASFLHRAEMCGEDVDVARWREVSEYALNFFPNRGFTFADIHAALAHAMVGETDTLGQLISDAKGPAADVVAKLAEAFQAFVAENWQAVIAHLTPVMSQHERVGGSRAQRDLIEFTMLAALMKLGRADDARLMLATRRPMKTDYGVSIGLG